MHGHCVEKIPHGECGSRDALQVFHSDKEGYTGYCFACDTYVPRPYGGKTPAEPPKQPISKSPEQLEQELTEIGLLPTVAIDKRALRKSSYEHFNVKMGLSEQDGSTPITRYFPYYKKGKLAGYKAKMIEPKIMWSIGDMKGDKEMFGWRQALAAGGKRLFITEGEDDAVALYQALKDKQAGTKWADMDPAIVSLSNGSSGVKKDLTKHLQEIKSNFKEVVFVFDMDEAGSAAARNGMDVIPDAKTVTLPEKDANDCVIKGKAKALAEAVLFKTATPKNTRIVAARDVLEAGRYQAEYGLSYPWEGLSELTRGMRYGETYYLGAGVKMGKSTIRSALASHLIQEHGLSVFMAAPEEANKKTVQLMCGQIAGKIFHDPRIPFDYSAYDKAGEIISDKLHLLDRYQHVDWTTLRADVVDAAHKGCKAIFIDPITNLTNGIASGEANTALQEIAQDLAVLALDHELIVWIFCHLKAPDSGPTHERGGKVVSAQFAGSRAMMRSCNMMVSLEGNKDEELPVPLRNQRKLVILEDREFGASGAVKLYYNVKTGLYSEWKDE